MSIEVANGPVSWGVDLPDKPGAPSWEEVFDEISEAGYRLCELGPLGYLPDDNERVRAELGARGLGVAGSYIFEPMHDRDRHDDINDVTEVTCARIAALGGKFLVVIDMVSDERGATAGRSDAATRLQGQDYEVLLSGIRQASAIAIKHGLTLNLHQHRHLCRVRHEVERVLADTSTRLQLCIDTGHFITRASTRCASGHHRERTASALQGHQPDRASEGAQRWRRVLRRDLAGCVLPGGSRDGRLRGVGRGVEERIRWAGHDRTGSRLPVDNHGAGRREGKPRVPARHRDRQLDKRLAGQMVRRVTSTRAPLAAAAMTASVTSATRRPSTNVGPDSTLPADRLRSVLRAAIVNASV